MVSLVTPGNETAVAVSANFAGLPQIATLSDGTYVITWFGNGADGDGQGVVAQHYAADGTPIGGHFVVNTTTQYGQSDPTIFAMADGGYMITWVSGGQDAPDPLYHAEEGIYAQRFDASGTPVGVETLINTTVAGDQYDSSGVTLSDGSYVITWSNFSSGDTLADVMMQHYTAAGVKIGGETMVNTATANHQQEPSIAALSDGGWIVAWSSLDQDGDQYGAYYQRYDASGTKVGGETRVSTHTAGYQMETSVTGLTNGNYVITFRGTPSDSSSDHMYQRVYAANGTPLTGDVLVNTYTASTQDRPNVTALSDGGYLVAWTSYGQQGQGTACYGQRFDDAGHKLGGEILLNAVQTGDQLYATVTALHDGGFAVAWESNQSGTYGVYQRVFAASGDLSGSNYIYGTSGNDHLDGGAGTDFLYGGFGDDVYTVDNTGDVVGEVDGQGHDTIFSSVSYSIATTYVETLQLTGIANINATGNSHDNILIGNNGANVLRGGGGNDSLNGAAGADTMIGGLGDDTYSVGSVGDVVTEASGEGNDTVYATISFSLAGGYAENLYLVGTDNINGTGNEAANLLAGNISNNVLDGGGGADTMSGGLGNDSYVVDSTGDVITEGAGAGTDTVMTTLSYILAVNFENLTLTGTSDHNGYGNAADNVLTGNSGNNALKGYDGNDSIDGGAGVDIMVGGLGDDTYTVDNSGDLVTESRDQGNDTVRATISYVLGTFVENLALLGSANSNGTGNTFNNVLTGNSGNNILDGGRGSDSMSGGDGNDTYLLDSTGDSVTEAAGQGTDTVQAAFSYTLGDNVENLVLGGTAGFSGYGNSLDNVISGNSGNNSLKGYAGHDILDGGSGNDTLYGGVDSDIFLFSAGSGADTVADFKASQGDSINVNAYTHGTAHSTYLHQVGADTTIDLGGGNIITVTNATVADVGAHVVW